MKKLFNCAAALFLLVGGSPAADDYVLTVDSRPQPGVPRGEVTGPFEWRSEIYPGTVREYWLYIPAQYDAAEPACVAVVQDGISRARGWNMIEAFDNLIHRGEIPVMIGIFVNHGKVPAPHENAEARYNRSFEYDALGDRYARFLLEEILPEVGRAYHLSGDPNDRMIAGASSGAIAAFNAAWERPDAFRRVFSTIGTYVGLRGGNDFSTLVRKTEAKPIRVFLQDGSNDLDIYAGGWWTANQDMLAALQWAGYDVKHAWGDGGHTGRHGAAILPEALRWLWRDYPEPIRARAGGTPRRMDLLIPGEDWELVSGGHGFTEGPAVNNRGEVFFTDIPNNRIHRIALDGTVSVFAENSGGANGMMFGGNGELYTASNRAREIRRYQADGSSEAILTDVTSNDLIATDRDGYFTDPANRRVYHVDTAGEARVVDTGIERPNGIAMSPDRTLLHVADTAGQFVYSFQIQPDGSLQYKQEYFHLHIPYGKTESGADGMTVDTLGHLYVATHLGVQICDQPGRVNLILPLPGSARPSNVVFGGAKLDTLFVTCGDKVYRRRINAVGVVPWGTAIKPPRPGL